MFLPYTARGYRAAPIWSIIVILLGTWIVHNVTNWELAHIGGVTFWCFVFLVVPQWVALKERHTALGHAYSLIHELGGQFMLDERLTSLARDASDQTSAISIASRTQFQKLHEVMDKIGFELADTIEEYLPPSDLAAAKARRKERIQKEIEASE